MRNFVGQVGNSIISERVRSIAGVKNRIEESVYKNIVNFETYLEDTIIDIIPETKKQYSNNSCDIIINTSR